MIAIQENQVVVNNSDDKIFQLLKELGKIPPEFTIADFERMKSLLDLAFEKKLTEEDIDSMIRKFELVMHSFRILPIEKGELPEEQAVTL